MSEYVGYSSRISAVLRSPVAARYLSLTLILLFILSQFSAWKPQQIIPPHSPIISESSVPITHDVTFYQPEDDFQTLHTESSTLLQSRIGKVTSLYYDVPDEDSRAYERALLSHKEHDSLYGYKHYIQRRPVIDGIWSKLAYLLHILTQELHKAPAERLDWLFWHDADVVLLNSLMPLETYLPPDGKRWAHINLLVSNDLGGLNDGVFFIRVCEWSAYLLAAGLSFPYYRPQQRLRYESQTALGFLLDEEKWQNNSLHVPQRWFNAYHNFGDDDSVPEEWNWRHGYVKPSDLLVHLPGTSNFRSHLIHEWLERVQTAQESFVVPLNETQYPAEIKDFWENDAMTENQRQDAYWRHYHILNDVGGKADDKTREGKKQLEARLTAQGKDPHQVKAAIREYEESRKEIKKELLRERERAMLNGTMPDKAYAD